MKNIDEMDRKILLHAEEWGYRTALLALSVWTLVNLWQTLAHNAEYNALPNLILCLSVCVQSFSQIAIKQKMVSGDEEYQAPNQLLRTTLMSLVVVTVILSFGVYFWVKA